MKFIVRFFYFCFLFIVSENTFAQTAYDYYLPLSVGNQLNLYSWGTNWGSRTITYAIEGTDLIYDREYFREKGTEVMDGTVDTSVFRVFWIRKDSVGNVLLGAISTTELSNIGSALLINWILFPNEFLTAGYSRTYTFGEQTMQDSVLSVTETVSVSAGTYNNCLKISETQFDSAGNPVFREYHYYALGIGLVKNERTLPVEDAHIDNLTSYVITGVSDDAVNQTTCNFSLLQNYPNPFNPTTVIRYSIPDVISTEGKNLNVVLKVYDVLGNEIAVLVNEEKPAGEYDVNFNSSSLTSGVYFYQLKVGTFIQTRKMLLLM